LKAVTNEFKHKGPVLADWLAAARFKFLPQGVMPVIIGVSLAYAADSFSWLYFILAFIAAACVQIGLTMLNDTLDYSYGTDKLRLNEKNPYSGGSGAFVEGRIDAKSSLKVIAGLYTVALVIAIYLVVTVGWGILLVAVIGAAISIIYSIRPFHLAYRGLGELAMLIGYGPIITMFAYYAQTGAFSWGSFWTGIIPGFCMFTMILINSMPDAVEDKLANKKNICYRLGLKNTKNLYLTCLGLIFIYVLLLVILAVLSAWCLLVLLGLPLAIVSGYYAQKYYDNPIKLAFSNKYMVFLYSFTMVAVALGILLGV